MIVIESGAIYSATVVALLIEQSIGGNLYYSCLDPVSRLFSRFAVCKRLTPGPQASSIIGIVFSLIIIRVNMSATQDVYASTLRTTKALSIQPMAFSPVKVTTEMHVVRDDLV